MARALRDSAPCEERPSEAPPERILAVDIGGTKVKILATGHAEPRKLDSGPEMTPADMVRSVQEAAGDWEYDAVSIGYPGLVGSHGPRSEPGNLGPGWVGFDFAAALGKPVRILNDAAMQALGGYEGGRMLFLGLGTGVGSTVIADYVIVPLELGRLPYQDGQTLGDVLGRDGMKRLGKTAWREAVASTAIALLGAFTADYVTLGGGNAKELEAKDLPPSVHIGNNLSAFRGGFRLWHLEDVQTLHANGVAAHSHSQTLSGWRII
jgi:hypothetical protein